jgi:hypothetical protein
MKNRFFFSKKEKNMFKRFGHKLNGRYLRCSKVCVSTANSLPHKEFSKIGNKVFIPTGVKNETLEVLFSLQGFTLSFHSLLEIQRASIVATALIR